MATTPDIFSLIEQIRAATRGHLKVSFPVPPQLKIDLEVDLDRLERDWRKILQVIDHPEVMPPKKEGVQLLAEF